MNAKIATIKIKYGEKEIELTEEEAKALKETLNSLFAKPSQSAADQFAEMYRKQREYQDRQPPTSPWQRPPITWEPIRDCPKFPRVIC